MDNKTPVQEVESPLRSRIPRWPAIVALLVIVGAYWVLSEALHPVSRELLAGVVVTGIVLVSLTRLLGRHKLVRAMALGLISAVTLADAGSALLLVALIPRSGYIPAPTLLRDGAVIWGINIVTFALWYWEIDAGGPVARRLRPYESKDFLFPQQARTKAEGGSSADWYPDFIDYLFLAFNHSTAFSPTDTGILSRKAKVIVMIQSSISLMTVAVIIAKAINAL